MTTTTAIVMLVVTTMMTTMSEPSHPPSPQTVRPRPTHVLPLHPRSLPTRPIRSRRLHRSQHPRHRTLCTSLTPIPHRRLHRHCLRRQRRHHSRQYRSAHTRSSPPTPTSHCAHPPLLYTPIPMRVHPATTPCSTIALPLARLLTTTRTTATKMMMRMMRRRMMMTEARL